MSKLAELPPKRRAFVLAYLGEAKGNATEAARMAGYAHPGTQGHRLLQNVHVASALESAREETTSERILTAEECQTILSAIAIGLPMEAVTSLSGDVAEQPAPAKVSDRIAAIKQLSKMRGYDAPKKHEHQHASLPPERLLARLQELQERLQGEIKAETIEAKSLPKGEGE